MQPEQAGPLRQLLEETAKQEGLPLKDLTVLATQNDPFGVDTAARHRDASWLAEAIRELGFNGRRVHIRGLHYMMIGRTKPNGSAYTNTEADWLWLSGSCAKAGRWLRYIPFDQIIDQRNAAPTVRLWAPVEPEPYISTQISVTIPDVRDINPRVFAWSGNDSGFPVNQPYKLVLIGEKSSLETVLGPVAEQHEADLYLPTGEISDTLMHTMASVGKKDGRPMAVLYFADCDPAGYQMAISVSRKLQAFEALGIGPSRWQIHRVALVPEQVREFGLPSTPLKPSELRGEKWLRAYGVQQTEIDALASLRPELLRQLAVDAIAPFYDYTLARRVSAAYRDWQRRAQAAIDSHVDPDWLAQVRERAQARFGELRREIDAVNAALRIDPDGIELPAIEVPEADLDDGRAYPLPLVDSAWPFARQCRELIASKRYNAGGEDA